MSTNVDAAIQATSPIINGNGNKDEVSTSSPYSIHNTLNHPNSVSHNFNIDSFDFGADFSLPSSLDELAIFHQANGTSSSQASQAGGSQASPSQTGSINQSLKASLARSKTMNSIAGSVGSSNNSVAGSPRSNQFPSPRVPMRDKVIQQQAANSRHQSPHSFSSIMHANDGAGEMNTATGGLESNGNTNHVSHNSDMGGGENNSGISLNTTDLQNLLQSINASTISQQEHQHQIQGNNNLSISELQRLLSEKEHMERAQSVQMTFLRQQLEALQRQASSSQNEMSSQQQSGQSNNNLNASQLMQQFQQLASQQPTSNGGNPMFSHSTGVTFPAVSSAAGNMNSHNAFVNPGKSGQNIGMNVSMNQYGLITPGSSDTFGQNNHGQGAFVSPLHIPGTSHMVSMTDSHRIGEAANMIPGSYTPLESPAITPASVFSNVGSTATSTDLFSPLTSPALHPQVHSHDGMIAMQLSPFLGPTQIKGRSKARPGASPVALTATKSIPRKNRSTTAEARANRARASPLVKPTMPTPSTQTRKRNESTSGSMPSPLGPNVANPSIATNSGKTPGSRRASQSESNDEKSTPQAFPPLSAGSGSARRMDASPSETAASTPSPIEMPPPNSKPMTPSSVMGIQSQQKRGKNEDGKGQSNGNSKSRTGKSMNESGSSTGKQVTFANNIHSPGSLQNIAPGGTSNQDREAWVNTVKSSGGGLESRRSTHKAAEQKRRDSLKFCFDELRGMLPAITLDDDVPGGSMLGPDGYLEDQDPEGFSIEEVGDPESARIANRAISKVALLRHSNEYLMRLKHRMGRRDRDLALCRREIMELRLRLGLPIPPEMPALTASIATSAIMMGHDMNGLLGLNSILDPSQNPHQAYIVSVLQQQMQQQQQLQNQNQQNHQLMHLNHQQMGGGGGGAFVHSMPPPNMNSMDTST